mmetsp:Transcript_70281/g.201378  ORF Transcript_70281/g.201378 Transcript_70281/m.201378 type:complete len:212 (+) Transcript_70281:918-1553(+)
MKHLVTLFAKVSTNTSLLPLLLPNRARPVGHVPDVTSTQSRPPLRQSSTEPLADTTRDPAPSSSTSMGSKGLGPDLEPLMRTSPWEAPRSHRTTLQLPVSATMTDPSGAAAMPSGLRSWCNPSPVPRPPATTSATASARARRTSSAVSRQLVGHPPAAAKSLAPQGCSWGVDAPGGVIALTNATSSSSSSSASPKVAEAHRSAEACHFDEA